MPSTAIAPTAQLTASQADPYALVKICQDGSARVLQTGSRAALVAAKAKLSHVRRNLRILYRPASLPGDRIPSQALSPLSR